MRRRCPASSQIDKIIVSDIATIAQAAKLEADPIGCSAPDHELSKVDCPVVERAYTNDILQIVTTAMTLVFDVM